MDSDIPNYRTPSRHRILKSLLLMTVGAGTGIYVSKKAPSWWYVRQIKYMTEALKVWKRMSKMIVEEYHLFDDVFATEVAFLEMTKPEPWMGVGLKITLEADTNPPPGEGRRVRMNLKVETDKDED
jgi:hypothetical protein